MKKFDLEKELGNPPTCPDPECRALLEWGTCPKCGFEYYWHGNDICPKCDYSGPFDKPLE